MLKTATIALSAALGIGALMHGSTAKADPYVRIGIGVPGVLVVAPLARAPVYYRPYGYWYGHPYWRRYGDRDDFARYHHDWDHRGDERRWEHRRFGRDDR